MPPLSQGLGTTVSSVGEVVWACSSPRVRCKRKEEGGADEELPIAPHSALEFQPLLLQGQGDPVGLSRT